MKWRGARVATGLVGIHFQRHQRDPVLRPLTSAQCNHPLRRRSGLRATHSLCRKATFRGKSKAIDDQRASFIRPCNVHNHNWAKPCTKSLLHGLRAVFFVDGLQAGP